VTMSFGVAASAPGDRFEYERVFAEADAALYEAKRSGRNRVCPPVPGNVPVAA
jgi:PleD family two-component response regulator